MEWTKSSSRYYDYEIITLYSGDKYKQYELTPEVVGSYVFGVRSQEQREKNIRRMYANILKQLRKEMFDEND